MAFRKRNIAVGRSSVDSTSADTPVESNISGVKSSTLISHPVISTGCSSLDSLLGGHGGLPLGSSLLLEESGTTNFAGAILKYFAAEGVCHEHVVHVVGIGEQWVRELPGIVDEKRNSTVDGPTAGEDRMKIAWRYEKRTQAGERAISNREPTYLPTASQPQSPFCHTFDLTKRLSLPPSARINHVHISPDPAPFDPILRNLEQSLKSSRNNNIHRLIIPTILSPALYPSQASQPQNFIRFLHSLRRLLTQYSNQLTVIMTLPLDLYSRSSGLIRWAEILCDGVLELTPFPHLTDASNYVTESGSARSNEEQPQGMAKVHKIPINTERGEGGAGAGNTLGDDLAFSVSKKKFVIKPFSLPPLEGDQEAQQEDGKLTGKDVEF